MATVNKDFKVKHGLVVEGAQGTINNQTILTEVDGDAYILALAGGGGDSANTANTLVKRDESGNFAASNVIVENELVIDGAGSISNSDDDFKIQTEEGSDFEVYAEDISLNADDDFRVYADDLIRFTSDSGVIHLDATNAYFGDMENAANRIATEGYVDDAIADIDLTYTTDDVTEATNLYFTNQRALDATSAAYDVAGAAAAAQTAAEATASADATTKANDAEAAAILEAAGDATTKANAAQEAAEDYADSLAVNYDVFGAAAAAQTAAEGFATQAIADLVDSAPATLDTLNELAAALQDNPDIISDLQDIAAGKQDTLTAGANIEITPLGLISVVNLDAADISDFNTAALSATSAAYDATGAAAIAQSNAEYYADSLAVNYDEVGTATSEVSSHNSTTLNVHGIANTAELETLTGSQAKADNAEANAIAHADALDTDDIAEGTAEYFTDARAKASAAALLTGATKTNITITGTGAGLTITAENGVADSDTDDLDEGTTNLYFTDSRAVDALEAVVPNFTAVEINSLAKQVAATIAVATPSQVTAFSFAKADYRSAKFLIKTAYGTHTELTEVLLTLDSGDNIAITEYATIGTNGSSMTVTADVDGANVRLRVTTVNNTSNVIVVGTLLA